MITDTLEHIRRAVSDIHGTAWSTRDAGTTEHIHFTDEPDPAIIAHIVISHAHLWLRHAREFNQTMREIGYSHESEPQLKTAHREMLDNLIDAGGNLLHFLRLITPWPDAAPYSPDDFAVMLDFMKRELVFWHTDPVTGKEAEDFLVALQNNPE